MDLALPAAAAGLDLPGSSPFGLLAVVADLLTDISTAAAAAPDELAGVAVAARSSLRATNSAWPSGSPRYLQEHSDHGSDV